MTATAESVDRGRVLLALARGALQEALGLAAESAPRADAAINFLVIMSSVK